MRTAISEFDTAGSDFGFGAATRAHRAAPDPVRFHGAGPRRPVPDRRPRGARPCPGLFGYDRLRVRTAQVGPVQESHPVDRVQRAQIGLATLAIAAMVTALAVLGLIGLAHLRAGGFGAERTAVVQVREGESLSDVAARVAPDRPANEVVRKIMELNGLRGAEVAPGRTITVPTRGR